jgi:hypothetical protein
MAYNTFKSQKLIVNQLGRLAPVPFDHRERILLPQ